MPYVMERGSKHCRCLRRETLALKGFRKKGERPRVNTTKNPHTCGGVKRGMFSKKEKKWGKSIFQ